MLQEYNQWFTSTSMYLIAVQLEIPRWNMLLHEHKVAYPNKYIYGVSESLEHKSK